MRTRKTFVLLCVCLAAAFLFCGCGVGVDVYEQQSDTQWAFRIDVSFDDALLAALDDPESVGVDENGVRWTMERWLKRYFGALAECYGIRCRFDATYLNFETAKTSYRFFADVYKATADESLQEGLTLDGDRSIKTNLFLRKIRVVRDDRFNYWIRQFDDTYARYEAGDPLPADKLTAMGILLFGYGTEQTDPDTGKTEYKEELPSLYTAFPYAATLGARANETVLRNFWYAAGKMQVAADDSIDVYDEAERRVGAYYIFEKTLGDGDTSVEYVYFRADPTGWYIVAVAAGGLVVGLVLLIAFLQKKRKNKKPPARVQDSFPYDPFADFFGNGNDGQRDGNDNGGHDDNDPFAGY